MTEGPLAPELRRELTELLVAERDRLRRDLLTLGQAVQQLGASAAEESGPGGDAGDIASDITEIELDLALEETERERLAQVEAALDRMEQERFGLCVRCAGAIDPERLRARPWAITCRKCAG